MIKQIVDEVHSHEELRNLPFTSIQIIHNTVSASHTDNKLIGTPSITIGLGDYVGGRLRIDGGKQPLHIHNHAVVYDGRKPHTSGLFNGDRWSLVLFVHSSWEHVSDAIAKQLIESGLPCPPRGPTQAAVPATEKATPPQVVSPSDDAETRRAADLDPPGPPEELPEEPEPPDEPTPEVEAVKGPKPKGTVEEAQPREHQMAHLPKIPFCDVCAKAKMQRNQKRKKVEKLVPDDTAKKAPVKFGEQMTADQFIKN